MLVLLLKVAELMLMLMLCLILMLYLTSFQITVDFPNAEAAGVCKKGVLKKFTKFTGLCQSFFFNKVAG